jgi:hypothetical protein
MDIAQATRNFESWLKGRIPIVKPDLEYKHQQMRADVFLFFRATFYRWAQLWPDHCRDLARLPEFHVVGDLHIENFGTWRDAEGRLVWGVNDFDEAFPMAFANDLVRLAVSAWLAAEASPRFHLSPAEICQQLIDGYRDQLELGGEPFILMEKHPELREMAIQELRQPALFWQRLEEKSAPARRSLPASARKAIRDLLPDGAEPDFRILTKPKGLGSLGRERFLALAQHEGGILAREAKTVAPSACLWASGRGARAGKGNPWLEKIVRTSVRCPDPWWEVRRGWLVRRLAPDCSRIDIEELVHHRDFASLLHAMGAETANNHLGTPKKARKRLRAALAELPADWLPAAARAMHKACLKDWRDFKRATKRKLAA